MLCSATLERFGGITSSIHHVICHYRTLLYQDFPFSTGEATASSSIQTLHSDGKQENSLSPEPSYESPLSRYRIGKFFIIATIISQCHIFLLRIPDDKVASEVRLAKGETVVVIGASPRRGFLVVEKRNHTIHVPHSQLELRSSQTAPPTASTNNNHHLHLSQPPLVGIGI